MRIIDQLLWEGCKGSPRKCWDSPVEIHGQQWSPGGQCQGAAGARTVESGAPERQRHRARCGPESSHYGQKLSSPSHHGYLFPGEERCQVDAAPVAQCNLYYGREACNVKPPNSDEAILLGARVLVDVTATGDINEVTAAKQSCSFVRQSAGRPPHLPTPGIGAKPSRGVKSPWSPSCSQQRPAAEFLYATRAPAPRKGADPIAGVHCNTYIV
ncbi:hypothetical protein TcYC6_0065120 [Trypanosoma cruzi]|nr:hypothetical protein TcYC6_0065120 [Trypanosoma cruzi]